MIPSLLGILISLAFLAFIALAYDIEQRLPEPSPYRPSECARL